MMEQKQTEALGSTLLRSEPPVTPGALISAPDHVHGRNRYLQTLGSGSVWLAADCNAAASGITSETVKGQSSFRK